MKIPTIHGIIDRRILINYVAEPSCVERYLPKPFYPKLYKGKAVVGICLIRLKNVRPKGFPAFVGVHSENGAHRIAVEWIENGVIREGVYIPRRDTSLKLNSIAGGKIFPGKHHLAKFNVKEENEHYHLDFTSSDGTTIDIDAKVTDKLNENSIFTTIEDVSIFFEKGSIGYSPDKRHFDGLKLEIYEWKVKPLEVENVRSSFFENNEIFPMGTVRFDNALLMENITHNWKTLKPISRSC
ncbi:MAG TPA: DUF2071 domain-containing protein [Chitinophagaceae bacterium]|nr:DUF2071 domain-containing protein [Chitinophagaceae bacterium]